MEKPIEIGSYVRVISGKYEGNIFEVFDRSENFLRVGINRGNAKLVDVNNVIPTNQSDFYIKNKNQMQGDFF